MSNLIVLLFAYLNIKGLKESSKVQNMIILTLVILVFSIFTTMFLKADRSIIQNNYILNYRFNLGEVSKVLAIVPFLFVGFDSIPQISKEFNFSDKKAYFITLIYLIFFSTKYIILKFIFVFIYISFKLLSFSC